MWDLVKVPEVLWTDLGGDGPLLRDVPGPPGGGKSWGAGRGMKVSRGQRPGSSER